RAAVHALTIHCRSIQSVFGARLPLPSRRLSATLRSCPQGTARVLRQLRLRAPAQDASPEVAGRSLASNQAYFVSYEMNLVGAAHFSSGKAGIGSTRVARRAGPSMAASATAANNKMAAIKASGSYALIEMDELGFLLRASAVAPAKASASPTSSPTATGRPFP